MLRKIMLGNMLACSLLMVQCGQTENTNAPKNVNSAMTNTNNPAQKPGTANTATPSPTAVPPPDVERPVGTPAKMPHPGELGNDANLRQPEDKPAPNTNANTPRKPRIEERKPPEREKP